MFYPGGLRVHTVPWCWMTPFPPSHMHVAHAFITMTTWTGCHDACPRCGSCCGPRYSIVLPQPCESVVLGGFGHALRRRLVECLQVRWETEVSWGDWQNESTTLEHYRGLLNNRPSVTWDEVIRKALQGKDESRVSSNPFTAVPFVPMPCFIRP